MRCNLKTALLIFGSQLVAQDQQIHVHLAISPTLGIL